MLARFGQVSQCQSVLASIVSKLTDGSIYCLLAMYFIDKDWLDLANPANLANLAIRQLANNPAEKASLAGLRPVVFTRLPEHVGYKARVINS